MVTSCKRNEGLTEDALQGIASLYWVVLSRAPEPCPRDRVTSWAGAALFLPRSGLYELP
jgi:hypothetical protein